MHDGGFRRWVMWGALASAAWLVSACGALPQNSGNETFRPGQARDPAQAGYNGTIKDIPTSIDPRTPEKDGTPGRSLALDLGERALREQQGQGGSGQASGSLEQGAQGSLYTPTRQEPAAQSIPGKSDRPAATPKPMRPEQYEK
jgi:hypothetical protein